MVLQSSHLRLRHAVRALAYTTCFFVDRETLMTLAERYPATMKLIRRFAAEIHLSLTRHGKVTAPKPDVAQRTRTATALRARGCQLNQWNVVC